MSYRKNTLRSWLQPAPKAAFWRLISDATEVAVKGRGSEMMVNDDAMTAETSFLGRGETQRVSVQGDVKVKAVTDV